MKNIVMLVVLVAVAVFLAAIPVHTTRGQAVATTHVENAKVTQGDNMSMDVVLDKGSNLTGSVSVTAFPDGAVNGGISLNCGLGPDHTQCKATTLMPLEAKLGKWVISEITFTPAGGAAKSLGKHGDSSFEVIAHGAVILPDTATVSDIK
jgi:hypothetical protein